MHVPRGLVVTAAIVLLLQCLTDVVGGLVVPATNISGVKIILWPEKSPVGSNSRGGFGSGADYAQPDRVVPIEMIGEAVTRGISYVGGLWDAGMQLGLEVARRILMGLQIG